MGFAALGTTAVVAVTEKRALGEACATLVDQLERLDRTCSRFRADSELQRANARAGATLAVSPLLAKLIEVALTAAETTGGRVDPTLGSQLRAAGYDRTFSLVRDRDSWSFAERRILPEQWRRIELDTDRLTLRAPHGIELDLGATAKAWASDQAARTIAGQTGCGVLVSLGGDIAVAGDTAWPIRIAEDHTAPLDGPGPVVSIQSGGLATSSTTVRRWRTRCRRRASCARPFDRSARGELLADGQRRGRHMPRRQRRGDGCDRALGLRVGLARGTAVAGATRCSRRPSRGRRRLARRTGWPLDRGRGQREDVLVPDTRDRNRRTAAAHRISGSRRVDDVSVAHTALAALRVERRPSQPDAVDARLHRRSRRHDGARRLCADPPRRCGRPVRLRIPSGVARARSGRLRSAAGARRVEPAAGPPRLPPLAPDPLARLRLVARGARPRARQRQRRPRRLHAACGLRLARHRRPRRTRRV